jgi:hypothetical protein
VSVRGRLASTIVAILLAASVTGPAAGAPARSRTFAGPITEAYPVLVGAGDIASCSSTGDNVYPDGASRQFADCYGPTWGRYWGRTRPATGNHDYHVAGAAGFFGYFGIRVGGGRRGFYAYNLGTWRIYVLNSNCDVVGCGARSAQVRWLRADLAAHPHRCVLAYWHHPLFSSGQHGNDPAVRPFWGALHRARAEVVVNGHDHDYERFRRQTPLGRSSSLGIVQFVVGTGGAGLRPFGRIKPNSVVRASTTHGVLRLNLYARSFGWRFVPVDGATFTDRGLQSCH